MPLKKTWKLFYVALRRPDTNDLPRVSAFLSNLPIKSPFYTFAIFFIKIFLPYLLKSSVDITLNIEKDTLEQ